MNTEHLERSATLPENVPSGKPERRTVASYERELIRMREVLAVEEALLREKDELICKMLARQRNATDHIARLTPRERQIMQLVVAGHRSKNIAVDIGISQRTVEKHRAAIMKKTGSKCLAALARLALVADWNAE
jgi:two-component system CheB/CheR fusion protein